MELIEASKVHETIIDYRDKATNVESEIELERAYGANDVGMLISQLPVIEAIPKADYETRLKADMVAMLTEIQLEIEEIEIDCPNGFEPVSKTSAFYDGVSASSKVVQQKINALKEETT